MSDYEKIISKNVDLTKQVKRLERDITYLEGQVENREDRLKKCYQDIYDLERKNEEYQIIIGALLKGRDYDKEGD